MRNKKIRGKKKIVRWDLIKLVGFCILYLLFLVIDRGTIYGKKALIWNFIKYMVYIVLGVILLIYLYRNDNDKGQYAKVNKIINKIFSGVVVIVVVMFMSYSFSIFGNLFKESKSIVTDNYSVSTSGGGKHKRYYYLYVDNLEDDLYISNSLYNRLLDSDEKIEVWYWENTNIIDKIDFID